MEQRQWPDYAGGDGKSNVQSAYSKRHPGPAFMSLTQRCRGWKYDSRLRDSTGCVELHLP